MKKENNINKQEIKEFMLNGIRIERQVRKILEEML